MSKLKPIIFQPDMVRAIIERRKTQTRRVIKPQPVDNTEIDGNFFAGNGSAYVKVNCSHRNWKNQFVTEVSPWQVGDVLWVRETFSYWFISSGGTGKTGPYLYKADDFAEYSDLGPKWKPSIHMPYEACRLWLKIVDIRVERLHDISEKDAIAEGIEQIDFLHDQGLGIMPIWKNYISNNSWQNPIDSYLSLWEKINGYESYDANPWVWVIEFERAEKP